MAKLGSPRLANGLEEDGEPFEVEDSAIVLPYRPHGILTVKIGP